MTKIATAKTTTKKTAPALNLDLHASVKVLQGYLDAGDLDEAERLAETLCVLIEEGHELDLPKGFDGFEIDVDLFDEDVDLEECLLPNLEELAGYLDTVVAYME